MRWVLGARYSGWICWWLPSRASNRDMGQAFLGCIRLKLREGISKICQEETACLWKEGTWRLHHVQRQLGAGTGEEVVSEVEILLRSRYVFVQRNIY